MKQDTSITEVTPSQELVMELLAARHRLGHKVWTLSRNTVTTRALRSLADHGLVHYKSGVTDWTYLAWLTEQGKAEYLSKDYVPPIQGGPL